MEVVPHASGKVEELVLHTLAVGEEGVPALEVGVEEGLQALEGEGEVLVLKEEVEGGLYSLEKVEWCFRTLEEVVGVGVRALK